MARSVKTTTAEEMGQDGGLLDVDGKYHVLIKDIRDGEKINGERMNKDGMTLRVTVLNGMHEGKFTDLTFNDGSPDDKDGGAFLDKRQAGMLLAANVLSVSDLNGDEISYDEQIARGSQALVKFKTREYEKNGETKTSFDVDGLHFY
ncbi:MAG: hypothetical protein AAFP69_12130, partial [Planctomycetota bacterium]